MNKHRAFFENGASRSEKRPAYHLVPAEASQAIAERMGMGWEIHGEENWKKGGPQFFLETRNHLEHHWLQLKAGDTSDNHLEAVLTNAAMLVWWERTGKAAWKDREIARCDSEIKRANQEAFGASMGALEWEMEKRCIAAD